MIGGEPFGKQPILRFDHVVVTVARKLCVHVIARLARFSMADSIRQHNEEFGRIQWLTFPEKFAGKFRPDKLRATSRRAVHDQYDIGFAASSFLPSA